MAQQMVCDGCESEPAVLLLTNIGNGDVQAVGSDCAPTWLRAMADAMGAPAADDTAPIDYMPTDSASPQYDPDTGKITDAPHIPDPAPPQPETDADARGTGDGTYDHGSPAAAPAPEATPEPAAPTADPDGGQTPPAPEDNPANPAPSTDPVPENAPGALVGV